MEDRHWVGMKTAPGLSILFSMRYDEFPFTLLGGFCFTNFRFSSQKCPAFCPPSRLGFTHIIQKSVHASSIINAQCDIGLTPHFCRAEPSSANIFAYKDPPPPSSNVTTLPNGNIQYNSQLPPPYPSTYVTGAGNYSSMGSDGQYSLNPYGKSIIST